MHFTQDFWIGVVIGAVLGFIICRATRYIARDTGPHVAPPPSPPE